jgi:hypothetical protein
MMKASRKRDQQVRDNLSDLFTRLAKSDQPQSFRGMAPAVKIGRKRKAYCPHCKVGFADLMIEVESGGMHIHDIKDPRRCNTCLREFLVKPQLQFVGVPLPGDKPNERTEIV